MTSGVPRFQELINATKKPKIVNNKIYLKDGWKNSLEEAKEIAGSNIACIYLKDLILSFTIDKDPEEEEWYEIFDTLYNTKYKNHRFCIKLKLNLEKMFNFKLTIRKIATNIEKTYPDVFCVFSPLYVGELHIYPDVSNITIDNNPILFITNDNKEIIYIEECVIPSIENICVAGIEGISEIFYAKEKDEWIIETNGINSRSISLTFINYKKLLALPFINFSKTLSNNVWDILAVLGIEAARNALIEEFMNIMEGINECHAILLVERMTFAGSISSITRYTMKKDENGPFGKASFEETMDNFLNAAAKGEIEPTESVSASIVCGKRAGIGTGLSNLKINIDLLKNI
jgi:DNA-directed RNA polymerase beta' subunit